jgi:protein SCO1/2
VKAALLWAFLALGTPAHERVVDFTPHLGASLPNDLAFREARIGDYYGRTPVVLVLGYLGCINLCGTTLDGVSLALRDTGLVAGRDYTALFMSVDPRDEKGPPGRRPGWHFLTGARAAEAAASAVGFQYYYDPASREFAHPAGFVVLTPDGHVARYFTGVRYDAKEVKSAIAAAGRGEAQSTFERVLLRCFHDPLGGRYTATIMAIVRGLMLAMLAGLGILAWRKLR